MLLIKERRARDSERRRRFPLRHMVEEASVEHGLPRFGKHTTTAALDQLSGFHGALGPRVLELFVVRGLLLEDLPSLTSPEVDGVIAGDDRDPSGHRTSPEPLPDLRVRKNAKKDFVDEGLAIGSA